jgi:hypothetical protein
MLVILGAVVALGAAAWAIAEAGARAPMAMMAGGVVLALWGLAALSALRCRRLRP